MPLTPLQQAKRSKAVRNFVFKLLRTNGTTATDEVIAETLKKFKKRTTKKEVRSFIKEFRAERDVVFGKANKELHKMITDWRNAFYEENEAPPEAEFRKALNETFADVPAEIRNQYSPLAPNRKKALSNLTDSYLKITQGIAEDFTAFMKHKPRLSSLEGFLERDMALKEYEKMVNIMQKTCTLLGITQGTNNILNIAIQNNSQQLTEIEQLRKLLSTVEGRKMIEDVKNIPDIEIVDEKYENNN